MAKDTVVEEWRPVPEFEGFYSISSLGRLRRDKTVAGARAGRILKGGIDGYGYRLATLCKHGGRCTGYFHRIVCAVFNGAKPPGKQVNHKNGIKTDNRACNLEWMTNSENIQHSFDVLGKQVCRGTSHWQNKLTEDDVRAIRLRASQGEMYKVIAPDFHISPSMVSMIATRASWKHVA